jgi:hypothetical protein
MFPKSKELHSGRSGEYQTKPPDYQGRSPRCAGFSELDPKDRMHTSSSSSRSTSWRSGRAVAEYTVYRALDVGKQRLGNQVKIWVDSAGNRAPAGHQLTKTKDANGYPDEVRTFSDGDKMLESWFYWTKGKSITFLDGQVFSQATFPPLKQ